MKQMQKTQSRIQLKCTRHWASYIGRAILAVIFLFIGLFMFAYSVSGSWFWLLLGALQIVAIVIDKKTYYVAMTDTKIVGHKGFLSSSTKSIPISKIEEVAVKNTLLGKIFGYHTISIDHSGSSRKEIEYVGMIKAVEFADAVNDRIDHLAYGAAPNASYILQQERQDKSEL